MTVFILIVIFNHTMLY